MKVVFVKPALETDATFDPIRTTVYLGIWYLASLLKEKGHEIHFLDEIVNDFHMGEQFLYQRTLINNSVMEKPLEISPREFQEKKMADFHTLDCKQFLERYSAFKNDGSIVRNILRTGNSIDTTLAKIERIKPDVVGIPLIASANYLPATKLGKAIKNAFPAIRVIFGGQHISAEHSWFLTENPWVDTLVTGDAITVINGVIEGNYLDKLVRGEFQTMDKFPLLDPSIISQCQYPLEPTYAYTSFGRRTSDFMFSKGCFRHCDFCMAGCQTGNHVTCIDYERIDEQLQIFKNYGIEELIVQDDAFIFKPKTHLVRVLGLMKKHGFYWQNNGGLDFELLDDFVTEQFIDYNRHGHGRITALYIPFNPRQWNKGQSAAESMTREHKDCYRNLKRLREEANIHVFTSEILGTPDHTIPIMEEDIDFHKMMVREGYLDAVYTLVATLLPGTKWNLENRHMIINERDFPGYSLFTVHHRTSNISDPRIIEEFIFRRAKELNGIQKSYPWGSAFPN